MSTWPSPPPSGAEIGAAAEAVGLEPHRDGRRWTSAALVGRCRTARGRPGRRSCSTSTLVVDPDHGIPIVLDGDGDVADGAMQASLSSSYSSLHGFFTGPGLHARRRNHGSGSADLNDDGTIQPAFAHHLGHEANPSRPNGRLLPSLLEIEFEGGRVYQYYNVPEIVHEQLLMAPSKGQFFNAQIKSCFPFSRA